MMEEASVSVRLNPFKGLAGPDGLPVPWSPYGRILQDRPIFTLDPLFHAGCYYVQDSSAMFVGHLFRQLIAPRSKASPLQTSHYTDSGEAETATAPGNRATLGIVRGGTASEAQRWGRAQRDVSRGELPTDISAEVEAEEERMSRASRAAISHRAAEMMSGAGV
jgi:hypothetical protein